VNVGLLKEFSFPDAEIRRPKMVVVPFCRLLIGALFFGLALIRPVSAADQLQWGEKYSRNMVSAETGLPDSFDPATGRNVKWVAPLGTSTYSTPVIADGKVLIGTNNENPRDHRHKGDRGVLMCLDEKDGSLCWQLVVSKIVGDPRIDWRGAGICSPATVEGGHVYIVSNRGEVMCLDIHGQTNGNDGPYTDEGRHMVPPGDEPAEMEVTGVDADIIWMYDMIAEAGVHQHDSAHCSILLHGDFLYVNTSNGLDTNHTHVKEPNAPSLIVLNKKTGRLIGRDDGQIGERIFHSTWSSPALGQVGGRTLVFFCGGDGVCYAYDALQSAPAAGKLTTVLRFDCDPAAPKENVHRYIRNRNESPSNIKSMPVFYDDRIYVTLGGDIWWGKNQAWLKCFKATGAGNTTASAELWSYPVERHCCTTPAVHEGLVFVGDCGKLFHCVDAETGKPYWTHQTKGEIWASALVADGKVYVGTRRREFLVFTASKEKQIISSLELDSPINASPVAANGVLYVATMKNLYAVKASAQ
jgi:outer membrane protein assembly factor BamB